MSDTVLFDSDGKFIGTDAMYDALPDDQKPKFLAVAEAATAADLASAERRDADAALTIAIRNHTAAKATRDRLAPRTSPVDAAKRWIAQQQALKGGHAE